MASGALRDRFDFYRRMDLTVPDGRGNKKGEWLFRYSFAAQRQNQSGQELVLAKRLEGVSILSIKIRYSRSAMHIDTDWKAIDRRTQEEFAIKAVTPSEYREWITINMEGNTAIG